MYVITSKTNNEIVVEVIKNGKPVREKMTTKFQVIQSEQITESMERLSSVNPGIISYVEVPKTEQKKSNKKSDQ